MTTLLPSVGARFKKWECCTTILPKCQPIPKLHHNTQEKNKKNPKITKIMEAAGRGPLTGQSSPAYWASSWLPRIID
jgi:hypothetical protein